MRRRAWNIFCALSLLIFATSVTLWVRSHFVSEEFTHCSTSANANWADFHVDLVPGRIRFTHEWYYDGRVGSGFGEWYHMRLAPHVAEYEHRSRGDQFNIHCYGFQLVYCIGADSYAGYSLWIVAFPIWLFLIFAVPPLLWWRKCRKRNTRGFPVQAAEYSARSSQRHEGHEETTT
jgi:hypothetical protein